MSMLSIIVSVAIAITPFFYRLFYKRPILSIEVIKDTANSSQFGIIDDSRLSDGSIDGNNATFIYKYEYSFRIIIRNNSDNNAYFTSISFQDGMPIFNQIDKLNELEPILAHSHVVLKAYYICYKQSKPIERPEIEEFPQELNQLEITLRYKNGNRVEFTTNYKHSNNPKNKFKPKFKFIN